MDDLADALSQYVREFEESERATHEARILSQRDNDYYHEKQFTSSETKALNDRGQPAIVLNEIKPKVNTMMGLEKQTRKDPKAFPRNPDDEDAARAATDAIRYVCDNSRWDDKRSICAKELAVEGTCIAMVGVTKDGKDPDIRRIPWDRHYADPASSEFDFADAKYQGVVIWMDVAEAKRKWPDAEDAIEATWQSSRDLDTYDDKPKFGLWSDYKRKRVRLCEHYCNDGGWKFSIFTKAGFVVEPTDSPYLGEDGEPECPVKAVSLYVDRDNNRYGEVRTMIGAQDALNKHRSKALHSINTRQVRVSPSTGLSAADVRKEAAKPDGVFIADNGEFEVMPNNDITQGNIALMQDAQGHIQRMGPNAAIGGKNEQALSGRAVMAQQQGGMVEAATYLDCIRVLSLAVYRSVWARVKQVWTEERWIRVTNDHKELKFVGLNRPITAIQQLADKLGVTKENMASQPPEVLQQLDQAMRDPNAQMVVGKENDVSAIDVDIILDEGLDTPTIQAEQFDTLTKMLPMMSGKMQDPGFADKILELVVNASQLRDKDKLLDLLKPKDGPPPPSPQEMMAQQAQMQAQMAEQQAQAEGQIEMAKAKVKAENDIQLAQIKAQADIEAARIKAEADMQIAAVKMQYDSALAEEKALAENDRAERKLQFDRAVELEKARVAIEAKHMADAESGAVEQREAESSAVIDGQKSLLDQIEKMQADMKRPRKKIPVRDKNGLITEVREVYEDET